MRSRLLLPTIFLLSFLIVQGVSGQSVDTTILYINKTSHFSVTGDGSASNWKDQPWVILPQRAGMEVPLQTRIKILYSDSGIYCLYSCEDRKITATLKEDFADLYN